METLLRDLRYGVRTLLREPGVTLLAILALALGIGASTAIFTVVDSVLLRPLPYKDPDRLVVALHGPTASGPLSPADYMDYRKDARGFERLAAAQAWGFTLGDGERPERITALQVSADLFDLLGVPPLAGRTFVEGDDQSGRDQIIVLGHALWQRRFGGDRSVIGRSIPVDGKPYVVVGVMPATFRFAPFWITRAEAWVPLSLERRRDDRGGRSLRVFGRLKDGVTIGQVQAEMTAIAARLERRYPDTNTRLAITVWPLLDKVISGIRPTLVALMAMVTFVLLIACANVANTLLARASGRQREIALRTAIGASRFDVVRQLLTESVMLAALGAVAGVVFATWGVDWLLAALPAGSLPRQQDIEFDTRVFTTAALMTLAAGTITGLAPALQVLKGSLISALQDGARGATEGAGRKRLRGLLVTTEVTLAVLLLAGATLMGRTMMKLAAVDPGFQNRPRRGREHLACRHSARRPCGEARDVPPDSGTAGKHCGRRRGDRDQPSATRGRRLEPGLHHRRPAGSAAWPALVRGLPGRRARLFRRNRPPADRRTGCHGRRHVELHARRDHQQGDGGSPLARRRPNRTSHLSTGAEQRQGADYGDRCRRQRPPVRLDERAGRRGVSRAGAARQRIRAAHDDVRAADHAAARSRGRGDSRRGGGARSHRAGIGDHDAQRRRGRRAVARAADRSADVHVRGRGARARRHRRLRRGVLLGRAAHA